MKTRTLGSLVAAVAAFAVACSDPTTPTGTFVRGPSLDVLTPAPAWPFPIADGAVQLCKTSNVGGDFDFDATGPAGIDTDPDITIPAGGGTVCAIIYTSAMPNISGAETVVITETANAAAPLTNIDIIQYLAPHLVQDNDYIAGVHLNDSESEATLTATVKINNDMARRVEFTNTAPVAGAGCTPGYWKQPQHFDSYPAGFTPGMSFNVALGIPNPNALYGAGFTLLDALQANGGGKNALARHAGAAILNAASGFYSLTVAEVEALMDAVLGDNSLIESTKNIFASDNEEGTCPLD